MKGAGATTSVPMVLQTGFGLFSGAHFEGKAPASGLGGALAAFAGPVTTETFGGVEGETYVGVSISTFAVSDHQLQVRASCEGVARSLRLASK